MKLKSKLAAACSAAAIVCSAAESSPLPVSQWEVKTTPDSELKLSGQNGVLVMDFKMKTREPGRSGHLNYLQDYADLLFKKPVILSKDAERIVYEFLDMSKTKLQLKLRPLIMDEEGELFVFQPHEYPHLNSGERNWGKWMTSPFFSGEAGAPSNEVYDIAGTFKNGRLDGKLKFIGFRLTLREIKMASRGGDEVSFKPIAASGRLALGNFSIQGIRLPYEHPFLYSDSLLKKKDTYKIGIHILNQFQGVPVKEFVKTIKFDPAEPASRKQKIEFPLGPNGNYWMEYRITDSKDNVIDVIKRDQHGVTAKQTYLRHQMENSPEVTPCTPADTKKAPAFGFLRINPDHKTCGVYSRPEPMKIELRVFSQGKKNLKVKWKLLKYDYNEVVDQGDFNVKNSATDSVFITPKTEPDRDAYRLAVSVYDGTKKIDETMYYTGFRTDFKKSHDRAGAMADRNEIKKQPYNRLTMLIRGKINSEKEVTDFCRKYFAQNAAVTQSHTYMIDLKDFEVLPGVFNFNVLDSVMDIAADYGCRLTIRLNHSDANGINIYRWQKYARQMNYDGTILGAKSFYGAYAATDPRTHKLWFDAYRALFDRYHKHTGFEGYYVMQPAGEWTVVDQPWAGIVAGYENATVEAFREYLKTKGSLKELNKRWNTSYSNWQQIQAPLPDFRGGMVPDLRPQWIDFCNFKSNLGNAWMQLSATNIRAFDDKRVMIAYGAPAIMAKLKGPGFDYGHNGGNHEFKGLGAYIDAWEKHKIGWITEPHHPHGWAFYGDPAGMGRVLDCSVWIMLAQAAGGGANLHVYLVPTPSTERIPHYGGSYAMDDLEKFKPILTELHDAAFVNPKTEVAVNTDRYTLYARHKTTFGARTADISRWLDLVKDDGVSHENMSLDRLADYKLLLPNIIDEVISPETAEAFEKAVRNGAKIIIGANTGKYVPEYGKAPFQLLKKFGITPPKSEWRRLGKDVTAISTGKNFLFDSGKKIPFMTGERLHDQLNSAEVRKNFWNYAYRWIPETDYFGYYPGVKLPEQQVLAKFADGSAAVSVHKAGKGEVVVFWGTPDISGDCLKGMMKRASKWAKVKDPMEANSLPYVREAFNKKTGRHYLLIYNEKPGTYDLAVPNIKNGNWFLDDLVSRQRLGVYNGQFIREGHLSLTWDKGYSPLKVIRMLPVKTIGPWMSKYGVYGYDTAKK